MLELAAGGWKTPRTPEVAYARPDDETMLAVVTGRWNSALSLDGAVNGIALLQ
jgi:hypothetical protein